MKQHSEKRAKAAVELLLKTMDQNVADIGTILDDFEETHDDYEKFKSKDYQALGVGYFALQQGIKKMRKILNGI